MRSEIKNNLLILLEMQLLSVSDDPARNHLIPIFHCLIGRLYDRLGDLENAIRYYSMGKFVSQRRIMKCVAHKYLSMTAESKKTNALLDVAQFLRWSHNMSAAVGLQAFRLISEVLLTEDPSCSRITPSLGPRSTPDRPQESPVPPRTGSERSPEILTALKLNLTSVQLAGVISSSVLNNSVICESNSGEKAVRLSIELLSDLRALLHYAFGNERDLDLINTTPEQPPGASTTPRSSAPSSFSTYFSKSPTLQPPQGPSAWYAFTPTIKSVRRTSDEKVVLNVGAEGANMKPEKSVGLSALDISAGGSSGNLASEADRGVSHTASSSGNSTSPGSLGSGGSTPLSEASPRPGTPLEETKRQAREGPGLEDPELPIFGLKVRRGAIAITVQCSATQFNLMQCSAVQCHAIQCRAVPCGKV
jgi:hypothetical protein